MFQDFMIKKTMAWLIGGELFDKIREVVNGLADASKTGTEKRDIALEEIKVFAGDTAKVLINFALEGAVLLLVSQQSSDSGA